MTSTPRTLYCCAAGAVRSLVTTVPDAAVIVFCRQAWVVMNPAGLYSSVIVWAVPAVPSPAWFQSHDPAVTQLFAAVVVTATDGSPLAAAAAATAPTVGSDPPSVHTFTTNAACLARACVAVTVRAADVTCDAFQNSTPPEEVLAPPVEDASWLLRPTSAHARPPESAKVQLLPSAVNVSYDTQASSNEFAGAVNDAVVTVVPVASFVACGGEEASIARPVAVTATFHVVARLDVVCAATFQVVARALVT